MTYIIITQSGGDEGARLTNLLMLVWWGELLDAYTWISFIIKGVSIVQKLHMRCDSLKEILFVIISN